MPTVIIPPTDVSPYTGTGDQVLATNPVFPSNITVNGTTDSSSKDTGAIVTEGGLGVEKSASIGGNLTVSGTGPHTFSGRLNITNTSGNVSLVQGAGAAGSNYGLRVQAGLNASDYGLFVTDSTSTSGYFIVRGDGSAKAFNGFEVGGNLTLSGTTSTITLGSTNTANVAVNSSGALTVTSANGQTLVSQTSSGAHYIEIKRASQSTGQVGLSLNGGTSGNTWLMYQPASSNTLTWFGNSANRMSLDTSGNLTLDTGNLTVSGTGNSTFAGNVGIGVTPNAWSGVKALQITNGVSSIGIYGAGGNEFGAVSNCFYNGSNWIYSTTATATKYAQSGGAHYFSVAGSGTSGNTITFSDAMTLANNGNLLIGTTTDGGQKLQVSGTAYVSGNFTTAGYLGKTNAAATGGQFLSVTGSTTGYQFAAVQNTGGYLNFGIESSAGGSVVSGAAAYSSWIGSFTNTPFYVCSNSAIALTLDSSQNATFAGTTVKISNSASPQINFNNVGVRDWYAGVQTAGDRLVLGTSVSSSGGHALRIDSSLNVTIPNGTLGVTGAVSIGNTVTAAASVASTHKVTMVIGGVTYYLLASNV